jgi:gliding motility-associated protein GldL
MALIDVNGKAFKNFLAKLYGLGAAVVILGAMFKILHLPGADFMLVVGLTTEAVIFIFSAFEKPHEEYDWSLVYPELAGIEGEGGDRRNNNTPALSASQELDKMLDEAKIDQELIESLGTGLRKFGDAASKLNETVDAAAATQEYGSQIKMATKNLESMNALYAVQLESSTHHMEVQSALVEKLSNSVSSSEQLSTEVQNLVKNISSLNNVYGNMLAAMNVRN